MNPTFASAETKEIAVKFGDIPQNRGDDLFTYGPGEVGTYIRGELDLVVEVLNDRVNPFCFAYSIEPNIEAWTPPSPTGGIMSAASSLKGSGDDKYSPLQALGVVAGALASHTQEVEEFWGLCSSESSWNDQRKKQETLLMHGPIRVDTYGLPWWYAEYHASLQQAALWLSVNSKHTDADKVAIQIKSNTEVLAALRDSIQLAHRLHARTPSLRQHYPTGKAVTVRIKRRALVRGLADKDAPEVVFEGRTFRTLSPIRIDIGVGPALTLRRKVDYDYAPVQGATGTEMRIFRTAGELDIDGVAMFSPYL